MTKYARFLAHGEVAYGVVEGDTVSQITAAPYEDHEVTDHTHTLDEVKTARARGSEQGGRHRPETTAATSADRNAAQRPGTLLKNHVIGRRPGRRRHNPERGNRGGRHNSAGSRTLAGHRQEGQARVQRGRARLYPGLYLRQRHQRAKTGRPTTCPGGGQSPRTHSPRSARSS